MFNVFSWLRTKAAEAVVAGVVAGVEDGIRAVAGDQDAPPPADLSALRARLAAAARVAALPPAAGKAAEPADAPARRRGK